MNCHQSRIEGDRSQTSRKSIDRKRLCRGAGKPPLKRKSSRGRGYQSKKWGNPRSRGWKTGVAAKRKERYFCISSLHSRETFHWAKRGGRPREQEMAKRFRLEKDPVWVTTEGCDLGTQSDRGRRGRGREPQLLTHLHPY